MFEAISIAVAILVAGTTIAAAITNFTNTLADIYAELKSNADTAAKAEATSGPRPGPR